MMGLIETLEGRLLMSVAQHYHQADLVSDQNGLAANKDTNLVNPWGLAAAPGGEWWVADNGTGLSTLYGKTGAPDSLVVTVPPATGGTTSAPTGLVANSTTSFKVSKGGQSGAPEFIFDSEDGTISGWSFSVDSANSVKVVDRSASGAVYKGLAQGVSGGKNYLYATNFHAGTVEVFSSAYHLTHLAGTFKDPKLPAGFAPFNIANIGGTLFVTYAKQDSQKHDDVAGKGNGYVDEFTTAGKFIKRFASKGSLNSPWGITKAPANFGKFSGAILVGNFGDGEISAFNAKTGVFRGRLAAPGGAPIQIDGLWALEFGNGSLAGPKNSLFFTAGPNSESHGLFGDLTITA